MSSLKDSEEQTSPPATPGSLGVQVASSHFSKISARSGKRGCLKKKNIISTCNRMNTCNECYYSQIKKLLSRNSRRRSSFEAEQTKCSSLICENCFENIYIIFISIIERVLTM